MSVAWKEVETWGTVATLVALDTGAVDSPGLETDSVKRGGL